MNNIFQSTYSSFYINKNLLIISNINKFQSLYHGWLATRCSQDCVEEILVGRSRRPLPAPLYRCLPGIACFPPVQAASGNLYPFFVLSYKIVLRLWFNSSAFNENKILNAPFSEAYHTYFYTIFSCL